MEQVSHLTVEEKSCYYREVFSEELGRARHASACEKPLTELIHDGLAWKKDTRIGYSLIPALNKTDPDLFFSQVVHPWSQAVYRKLHGPTDEKTLQNLIHFLNLENRYDEDGFASEGTGSGDRYFEILDTVCGMDHLNILPDPLTEKQKQFLAENGMNNDGFLTLPLKWLQEKGMLKEFGVYDKIWNMWKTICAWRSNENGTN